MDKNNFENEIFSENELEKLNGYLKENENIVFPENISEEKIKEKISGIVQESFAQTDGEDETAKKRKRRKNIYKYLSVAAVFIVVLSSLIFVKPWQKTKPQIEKEQSVTVPQKTAGSNYAEIEKMFKEYAENCRKKQTAINAVYGTAKMSETADGDVAFNNAADVKAVEERSSDSANGNGNHGETNEQVEGVNEADIIKNDGEYLYVVKNTEPDWSELYNSNGEKTENGKVKYSCEIAILKQNGDGTLEKVSTVNITPPENSGIYYMYVNEFFVKDDIMTVLLTGNVRYPEEKNNDDDVEYRVYYGYYDMSSKSVTLAVSFDIKDRSNPVKKDSIMQDGTYISSRMTGNRLVLVSDYYVNVFNQKTDIEDACIPKTSVSEKCAEKISENDICIMDKVSNSEYLLASVCNTNDMSGTYKVKAVLGGGKDVYCTENTLYVTNGLYENPEKLIEIFGVNKEDLSYTQILKFDITNDDIVYKAKGKAIGNALNQFSIDEYDGNLRIATTVGFRGENLENYITVLDGDLKQIGFLSGIAKGETIKSVRFTGKTGYVVTFEQTDPLFVVDLSNPASPVIKGELKMPGFSDYLHPITDTLLLGVGVDGTEEGAGRGLKVSLYDVSDPSSPKECAKYEMHGVDISRFDGSYDYEYIYSDAFYDHKAFCYDKENNTAFIPFEDVKDSYIPNGDYKNNTSYGSLAFRIDTENKRLELVNKYMFKPNTENGNNSCSRVTYTGDILYNLNNRGNEILSYNIDTGENLGKFGY